MKVLAIIDQQLKSVRTLDFAFQYLRESYLHLTVFQVLGGQKRDFGPYLCEESLPEFYIKNTLPHLLADRCDSFKFINGSVGEGIGLEVEAVYSDLILTTQEIISQTKGAPEFAELIAGSSDTPLLVLPKRYQELSNILMLFDGSSLSLKTIKDFVRTFSTLCRNEEVNLLLVNEGVTLTGPHEKAMVNYLKSNCNNLGIQHIGNTPLEQLRVQLQINESTMVVAPAHLVEDLAKMFDTEEAAFVDNGLFSGHQIPTNLYK